MKVSFSQDEAAVMLTGAMEEGWDPFQEIKEVEIHSLQAQHQMTIKYVTGVEIRFTGMGVIAGVHHLLRAGKGPVISRDKEIGDTSLHNSEEEFLRVQLNDPEDSQ